MTPEKPSTFEKLQNLDKRILYMILVVLTTIPLFPAFSSIVLPCEPAATAQSFYYQLSNVPEGKTVFIQSDWTISTRGENAGHIESLLRIVMSKKLKFVIYTVADAQAPGVYREYIRRINDERKRAGLKEYKQWEDYVDLAYFPNAEGTLVAIGLDVRKVFNKRVKDPSTGQDRPVFESPVMKDVYKVGDAGAYVVVTASSSVDRTIERLSDKTKIVVMCTGVIGPSTLPFFQSGQIKGVSIGLKGAVDVEYMMKYGLNYPDASGKIKVPWAGKEELKADPVSEGVSIARGSLYFMSFHMAILLLILAVAIGNIGMFLSRRKKG